MLQADLAETGSDRIVAPLALAVETFLLKSPLAPRVNIDGTSYFVITTGLIAIPTAELATPAASLAQYRSELVAAIDYLFLGV